MKRRSFLKSLGAASLAPLVPLPSFASMAVGSSIPIATYQWAETIVRAHNSCTLGMLQRHLRIDATTAATLKSQLVRNGVISAQANAYGMHAAAKPLFEGAFLKPHSPVKTVQKVIEKISDQITAPKKTAAMEKEDVSDFETEEKEQSPISNNFENACNKKQSGGLPSPTIAECPGDADMISIRISEPR